MNKPIVSVVIPVYNTADFIAQTLGCISSQSLREIEILVVDDGSTDRSPVIVKEAAEVDERIRIITQANQGLSGARNTGLGEASGEFVYFMDSDDLLERDALELCYEKCRTEALDFVFFDADTFGVDNPGAQFDYHRAGAVEDKVYPGEELLETLIGLRKYKASACLSFIRTDFLRRQGLLFYPGILHEDELFTAILYLSAERVGRIDRAFFKRRFRENSIMTTAYGSRNVKGYLTVARELRRFARQQGPRAARIVEQLLGYILNQAVFNAWALPLGQRLALAGTVLAHYPKNVRARSVAILLLKKPMTKLTRR